MLGQARDPDARPALDRVGIRSIPLPEGAELQLAGELTLATVNRLREQLRETESTGPDVVVLDLRQIRFVDSTVGAVLIAADTRARAAGRRLVLHTATGAVERLLALTGLDRRFETRHS